MVITIVSHATKINKIGSSGSEIISRKIDVVTQYSIQGKLLYA